MKKLRGSRRDQEEGGGAGPSIKLAQNRSRAGWWRWAQKVGLLLIQQCYGHCPCDCSAQQLKLQLRGTLVATQWRGGTPLTFWLFGRRSTASSVAQLRPIMACCVAHYKLGTTLIIAITFSLFQRNLIVLIFCYTANNNIYEAWTSNRKGGNRALRTVQSSIINYRHVETPQADNNND